MDSSCRLPALSDDRTENYCIAAEGPGDVGRMEGAMQVGEQLASGANVRRVPVGSPAGNAPFVAPPPRTRALARPLSPSSAPGAEWPSSLRLEGEED
jgi:hypothetical protein